MFIFFLQTSYREEGEGRLEGWVMSKGVGDEGERNVNGRRKCWETRREAKFM